MSSRRAKNAETRSTPIVHVAAWAPKPTWSDRALNFLGTGVAKRQLRPSWQAAPRGFDAVQSLGGVTFFAIMGLSAYGEWLFAAWLWRTMIG